IEPAARDEEQREAGTDLLVVDADGASFVERHGDSPPSASRRYSTSRRPLVVSVITRWLERPESERIRLLGRLDRGLGARAHHPGGVRVDEHDVDAPAGTREPYIRPM